MDSDQKLRLRRDEPNLDLLRAIAVLAVLVAHTSYAILGESASILGAHPWEVGRIGVSMFFVHTSLVLFGSLSRTGLPNWVAVFEFYVKRAFRIYPLAIGAVVLVLLAGLPPSPDQPAPESYGWPTILSNLLLIQNLTYSESIIAALWSLPIEVQMYVLIPGIYWIGSRAMTPSLSLAVVLGGCAMLAWLGTLSFPGVSRLTLLGWAPCFAAGFIAWIGMGRVSRMLPGWMWPMAMSVAMFLFVPVGLQEFKDPSRSWLMCIALGLFIPFFKDIKVSWLVVPGRIIAKYSYGIYLVHQSVLFIAFVKFAAIPIVFQWTVFLLGLAIASAAAFHLIEKPGMNWGRSIAGDLRKSFKVSPVPHA